ncbi:hypothetical protein ABZW96_37195 [Nocardia sp. NPDC004168]|uniref:hypothetical protein n=1 Tax=Nocardia sp. NPDC004168 TaxID=3154452 RepID=UPI0033A56823
MNWNRSGNVTPPDIARHTSPQATLVDRKRVGLDVPGYRLRRHELPSDAVGEKTKIGSSVILEARTDEVHHRLATTVGTINADVLTDFVPGFRRGNSVEVVQNSANPSNHSKN